MAERAGVSVATVSRLENGTDEKPPNTSEANVLAIARQMGPERGARLLAFTGYSELASELEQTRIDQTLRMAEGGTTQATFRGRDRDLLVLFRLGERLTDEQLAEEVERLRRLVENR